MSLIPSRPRAYNAAKLLVIIGGQPISGFAPGDDAVKVTFNSDEVDTVIGATGEGAFVVMNDRSGEIEIKLLSTSNDNAYLSGLLTAQRLGDQINTSVVVKDLNGLDVYAATFCRIANAPARQWGVNPGPVTWRFKSTKINSFAGGSL